MAAGITNHEGFPYAFMDPSGFLIVHDEEKWRDLQSQGFIKVKDTVNVARGPHGPGDISRIPGYMHYTLWVRRRKFGLIA